MYYYAVGRAGKARHLKAIFLQVLLGNITHWVYTYYMGNTTHVCVCSFTAQTHTAPILYSVREKKNLINISRMFSLLFSLWVLSPPDR